MSRYRKLTTICAAVVLSLGLAACGGGGGSNLADQQQNTVDYAKAVTEARAAAKVSYTAAETDAGNAETAADAAEATASGTPDATAARTAATAARTAADAAKAAHDAIEDGKTKADADAATAQAAKAADEAANANTAYMTAKARNDAIQTAKAITDEQNRKRDVAAATSAASSAATAARTAATEARTAATNARNAANAARDSYMAAIAARTDSTEAKAQYDAADAAATAAETAATTAEAAATAAEAAHAGIDANGSGADAQAAQSVAETKQDEAETAGDTASTQLTAAMTAKNNAGTSAGTHGLGLLMAANAYDVKDVATTPKVDEQAEAVKGVAAAIAAAAANQGSGTVSASWPGNSPDNPETTADDPVTRVLTVTINGVGGAITSDTKGTDRNTDDDTADAGEGPNASMITGLTGFTHGFAISAHPNNSNDPDGRHAIIFTDKKQGKDQTFAKNSKAFGNQALVLSRLKVNDGVTLTGTLENLQGNATYDHDGDPNTKALSTFTLGCSTGTATDCTVRYTGTTIDGFSGGSVTISAGAQEIVAAAPQTEDATYLAFGVWLQEDTDNDATNGLTPAVGAVAGGGSAVTNDTYGGADVTGEATYRGAAMGVYTQGKAVDYFQGDAELIAKFGEKPDTGNDTALGTISGSIKNIVAGGVAMSDVISLHTDSTPDNGNISPTGAITGNARMGAPKDDGTYTYNGSWRGQFYNGTADDEDTSDVDEKDVAPGSVAGTFGVTGEKDDVTTSYVGAFGAHKQ